MIKKGEPKKIPTLAEKRPFLIRKKKENKFHLIPITSQKKKKIGPLQKLISAPNNPTSLFLC